MRIVLTNNLRLADMPPDLERTLIDLLKFPNPKWLENERLGRWNRSTPRELRFFDKLRDGSLWIPKGYLRQLILLCRRLNVSY